MAAEESGEFGTGALPLRPDWRDFMLHKAPGVEELLPVVPDSFSLRDFDIGPSYNQGSEPSCVAFSSCAMESFYEAMERKQWLAFDGHALYRANGGDGRQGVDSRKVLQYMVDTGAPLLGSSARYRIKQYAFVDFSNFEFAVQTIKAAIFANRPVVVAHLIPSDMMSGMNAGQGAALSVNNGYHQVMGGAFTPERFVFKNSWSDQYGDHGWGSYPWAYLAQAAQRPYLYAYTTFDAPDEDGPTPLPKPLPKPLPTPVELSISNYQGASGTVPQFRGGGPLTIAGKGLNAGALQVTFGAAQLPVGLRSAESVLVTLPPVDVPTCGVIKVQREAVAVSGPLLVVTPNGAPPPPPPSDVVVQLVSKRFSTGIVALYAAVHNSAGAFLAATCTGTVGTLNLPPRNALNNGTPAAWSFKMPAGTVATIKAVAMDGRSGTGTATL